MANTAYASTTTTDKRKKILVITMVAALVVSIGLAVKKAIKENKTAIHALPTQVIPVTLTENWSDKIVPPPGVNFYFEGPDAEVVYEADKSKVHSTTEWVGINADWLQGFRLRAKKGMVGQIINVKFVPR